MDETGKPEHREFQFSIRKLMLWTVVVAFYFAVVGMLPFDLWAVIILPSNLWAAIILLCLLAFVGLVRGVVSVRWAAIASVTSGLILGHLEFCTVLFLSFSSAVRIEPGCWMVTLVLLWTLGFVFGVLVFWAIELGYQFVNQVENFRRRRNRRE
jgi:hypothetical protein